MTVVGILIGIGTAFIAAGYNNIMNYIQLLFSYFNAPLFATFIIAMFWKRTSPWAGCLGAGRRHGSSRSHALRLVPHRLLLPRRRSASHDKINAQMANFYGAIAAFVVDAVVTVAVTPVHHAQAGRGAGRAGLRHPRSRTRRIRHRRRNRKWWESPELLG